ncbi:MAG: hypothetical protein EXR72_17010 [Myxococcales bacterium]|nr:hypothetical protein [Myxococcales bacterium]
MTRTLFALVSLWAFVPGCGRSGLLGGDAECPAGQVPDRNGDCVAGSDMGRDGFTSRDMRGDSGSDSDVPCEQRLEICNNNFDDNCNSFKDCEDPQCAGAPNCFKPGQEICNNGIDDDTNGKVDCADEACETFPGCEPHKCNPKKPDCADPACVDHPSCKNLICKPTVNFGTLNKNDSKAQKMVSTVGTMDVALTPCAPGGGGMVVSEFTVAMSKTSVRLDFTQPMGADHVFGLFREGVNQKCDANPLGCYDPKGALKGTTTWTLDAGHYFLIIQAFTKNHQGAADVTLTTPPIQKPEICDNGVDDDGNNLLDCADPACFGSVQCKNQQCNPDINVGTLVLNDPPKHAGFDTKGKKSDNILSCAGGKGEDVVVQFSLKETVGVLMDWSQSGDHVVGLYQLPGNGNACDAIPLSCYDPSGRKDDLVAWSELPPGSYMFIFQALKPGLEGHIEVDLSAFRNRKIELCHNAIDDDGDGIIDCNDPDCFPDPGCGAPVCVPDVNLGVLHLGQQASTMLDVTGGHLNEKVSCAKGGGKSRIVRVTLAENAGMGFSCNMTGDHVLGLFAEAGVRDACDKLEVVCGDPKVIPFGCNYEIPNLQPGTYFVIVQSFQAGTEGKVNLTLSSIMDRALEICNNGKDEDMDGFTDCADRKCATSPFCIQKQCKPDAVIDPMPINGMPVFKLVQTANQQVTAQPSCQTKPGGGNTVISINMPAKANLKVEYAQIGSHVFAIYPNLGVGLICEAGKALSCTPSKGVGAGVVTFPNLLQGKYWFVMAADQPGNEGSASLKFSATP